MTTEDSYTQPKGTPPDVDQLAQFIRKVDGRNEMGAGALAEKIVEWLAVQAPAVQAGMALVPVEPTPAMLRAHSENTDGLDEWTARNDWDRMLRAAPHPPVQGTGRL